MTAYLPPNWFASVMGTGIVAVAAVGLPLSVPGVRVLATGVWLLAAMLLLVLIVATALHWIRFPEIARGHRAHPVLGHFYGAIPMALMTVGAGTLLLGHELIGAQAAIDVDWGLWGVGTVSGLGVAVAVPYTVIVAADARSDAIRQRAFGGWLMSLVPPMVSAATGALLLPNAAPGQVRETMFMLCYVLFGMSLFASVLIITMIFFELLTQGVGPTRLIPTLWIVLGPLGQSVTAANLLGNNAHSVLPAPYAAASQACGLIYGVVTIGFALFWAALCCALTLRACRAGLAFSLTFWSFVFPVGTCVTAANALAIRTDLSLFRVLAAVGLTVLVSVWLMVAIRTVRGYASGELSVPGVALNLP